MKHTSKLFCLALLTGTVVSAPIPDDGKVGCAESNKVYAAAQRTCIAMGWHGSVKCFGSGENGVLGYGDRNNRGQSEKLLDLPYLNLNFGVQYKDLTINDMPLGSTMTCVSIQGNDNQYSLRCWGKLGEGKDSIVGDELGEMGLNVPSKPREDQYITAVAGGSAACMFSFNKLQCWGDASTGILGDITNSSIAFESEWTTVVENIEIEEMAIGSNHACFSSKTQNGGGDKLHCWGANKLEPSVARKVLGRDGSRLEVLISQDAPLLASETVKQIAIGYSHTCLLLNGGIVRCFGEDTDGVLGLFGSAPGTAVDFGTSNSEPYLVQRIAAGHSFNCAWLEDINGFAGVKCWGNNDYGQLGVGDTLARGADPKYKGNELPFVKGLNTNSNFGTTYAYSLAAGSHHACTTRNELVHCWGRNQEGQLGLGHTNNVGTADHRHIPASRNCPDPRTVEPTISGFEPVALSKVIISSVLLGILLLLW